MKKLNILLISNMYPSDKNPSYGIFVKKIEVQLIKHQCIFNKIVIDTKSSSTFNKLFKYLNFYCKIILTGIFDKYDMVYAHYPSHISLPLIIVSFIKPKSKIVIHFHGSDVTQINNVLLIYLTDKLAKISNLIIAPSHPFISNIVNKYDANEKKMFVSPSGGINTSKFSPQNHNTNIFTIGYISRIDNGKGWDVLLNALAKIKEEKLFEFKCIIGGDGAQKNNFISSINNLDLAENVNYIGLVKPEDLHKTYNLFDVFVFPSLLNESLGLVGLEAMSCGIPIIASNLGNQTSYITHNQNGYLYNGTDSIELKNTLVNFYNLSQNKKDELKINARNTALQYDEKLISQQLYNKLLEIYAQ